MTSRQLRYNTSVIYNGQVGQIKSISNTDSIKIQLDTISGMIDVKKNKVKTIPHDKGELVKLNKTYYVISTIFVGTDKNIHYELNYINSNKKGTKTINIYDTPIISIDKTKQEKTISFLKFIDRYNSTISFLNKKKNVNTFTKIDYKNVDIDMHNYFTRCKLIMSQLNKIHNMLKKTQNHELQINNIYVNPFDFISEEFQLITYDKAEKICNEYKLIVDFKIKLEKWCYHYFLGQHNTFYIIKWKFMQDMKKFCVERQENHTLLLKYIETIVIDKTIESEIYKTTNYLLNIEKKLTDLTIDLFYNKEYDIPESKITEIINNYQDNESRNNKTTFTLEKEQRESVINSIQNKLSVITGPPGTGKTTIISCINYVLFHLYMEEYNLDRTEMLQIMKDDKKWDNEDDSDNDASDDDDDDDEYPYIYQSDYEIGAKYISPNMLGLMAPTGLAFINMQRSQRDEYYNDTISGTCHRNVYHTMFNIQKHKQKCGCECKKFSRCKYRFKQIGLLELDESSMLDTYVFREILNNCKYFGSRLILLGDVDQLPSIGPGQILNKLINSNLFSVTKLTKIKRQTAGSLVSNILKMRTDIINISDFTDNSIVFKNIERFVINNEIHKESIIQIITDNNFNKHNSKFITYFNSNKFIFNTTILNNILQNVYNPLDHDLLLDEIPSNNKYENSFTFRVGDRIIRTDNDYSTKKMRANGEEATITEFDGKHITILYSGKDDKPEPIGIDELYENFMLNYCVTIHKSQGSQYDNVIFFIEPDQTIIDKKSMYTAISRARQRCIIISKEIDFINLQKKSKKLNMKNSLFMEESDNYNL
jgi:energy-coupling factor transporter ATP-binding protein EcfA2